MGSLRRLRNDYVEQDFLRENTHATHTVLSQLVVVVYPLFSMQTAPRLTVPLRITVVHPPPGVRFAIQHGKSEITEPSAVSPETIVFNVMITVDDTAMHQPPRLLGAVVQGPRTARFMYVNSGTRAGQFDSRWDRRAKVPLSVISWEVIRQQQATPNSCVAVSIEGRSRDGGPNCATVQLIGTGWHVAPQENKNVD